MISSPKHVKHNHVIIIPITGSEKSQKAPGEFLHIAALSLQRHICWPLKPFITNKRYLAPIKTLTKSDTTNLSSIENGNLVYQRITVKLFDSGA